MEEGKGGNTFLLYLRESKKWATVYLSWFSFTITVLLFLGQADIQDAPKVPPFTKQMS